MAKKYGKYPAIKETNPGYAGAKTGTKSKMLKNPLGVRVLAGNKTKGGGIFRATKGKS